VVELWLSRSRYTRAVHEMGIAVEVYRSARTAVEERGGGRLVRVKLAVGELSAVEPDLLSFAWEALTVDGPDAGSVLEVEFHPAVQRCATCGIVEDRTAGSWLRLCPTCDLPLAVEGGDELDIVELAFEQDDAPDPGEPRKESA